ncbi:deoxyribose-phosphate aldolase [Gallibacterium genomosp. 2]|uniref:Deoxyribose-phosphate aldolase n=1 Tax=Gallibacterium genomosp. 2 TaxID=155517 RepID=A0A0A2XRL0_9PAST|nr:deoxyribose-phosphate aldolase [Gallibacterium genomosp. 2]KGQ33602.1 deoxyribose-phosphate aldolase [Gallibacterium genomosp. 2]
MTILTLTQAAELALSLMDLTTLNTDDTDESVISLCDKEQNSIGQTAAVCIYPPFIQTAKTRLQQLGYPQVKVATVTNFPQGAADIELAKAETEMAIKAGADEVDVVFPYRALMAGDEKIGAELVRACKQVCGNKVLKVIIESGELKTAELIRKASEIAIRAGADFIKTSTGKVTVNATLDAAKVMLETIRDLGVQDRVGFKAAGGVRTAEEAQQYLQLAADLFGEQWLIPRHFRFGASGLLNDLLSTLGEKKIAASVGY